MPCLPAVVSEQTASPAQRQSIEPPQPSGKALPHFPAYAAAHVFGVQQVPFGPQIPWSAQAFVTIPPQPSSKWPQATLAASGGSAGVQGVPHLPFALHTCPDGHLPQSTVPPAQALLIPPHSRLCAAHSRDVSGAPHRFAMPFVAHESPAGQLPHETTPPQPSEM